MIETSFAEGIIETETVPISVQELSYFLYHFRAVYVEALHLKQENRIHGRHSEFEIEIIAEEVAQRLATKGYLGVSNNSRVKLPPEEELAIINISRRNPIDIVFSCVGVALAAAVIISGGEIKWDKDGFKVKLPPLGRGIAELKKAMKGNYQPITKLRPRNNDSAPSS